MTRTTTDPHEGDGARMLTRAEGANEPLHLDQANLRPGDVARGRAETAVDDDGAAEERREMVRRVAEEASGDDGA